MTANLAGAPVLFSRRLPMRLIVTTTACAGCRSFELLLYSYSFGLQFLSVKYRRVLITIGFPSIIVKCSAFQLERVSLDTASRQHLQTCICAIVTSLVCAIATALGAQPCVIRHSTDVARAFTHLNVRQFD